MSGDPFLIVSPDTVGPVMAGPGIRYVELARVVARSMPVLLAAPDDSIAVPGWSFELLRFGDRGAVLHAARQARATLIQGDVLSRFPELRDQARTLVVDLYDPFLFESLRQQSGRTPQLQAAWQRTVLGLVSDLLLSGDFFLCASERQRDLWLGMLAMLGRLSPGQYALDSTLRRLLDVVPFGIPDQLDDDAPPRLPPAIAPGDPLLYWGGGLWDWLDPLTVIRAVDRLRPEIPNLRLFFAGTKRPNADAVRETPMLDAAVGLSRELGLTDRQVFFHDWVPYGERWRYLRRAQLGLVLDLPTPETRFAYRTRVLDHIWAGLPTLITEGSVTADLIAEQQLGQLVPQQDVAAVADGVRALLGGRIPAAQFDAARSALRWERVSEPLLSYLEAPYRTRPARRPPVDRGGPALWQLPWYGLLMVRESGVGPSLRAARTYLQYLRSRKADGRGQRAESEGDAGG